MWIRKISSPRMRATEQMRRRCRQNLQRTACRPFHGLEIPLLLVPGVSLAKPRSTPGFMLAPAPQAKADSYARRETMRAKNYNHTSNKSRRVRLFLISTLLLLKSSGVIPQAQCRNLSPKRAEQQTQDDPATPLMRAAFAGRIDEVCELLKSGVDVNEKDGLGFTALMFAVGKGHIDAVKVLLQAGADPNAA